MYRTIIPIALQREDRYKMEAFLGSISEIAPLVEAFLKARGTLPVATFRHFHHKKSQKASFVAATGERLLCFTVVGLTSELAALIDSRLGENERWDLHAFRAAISRILCEPPYRDDVPDTGAPPVVAVKTRTREPSET
jgi:hypothetical protein